MTLVVRDDLSQRTSLSKSALVSFDLCQSKAWFQIHEPRQVIPNERMSFGSAVDAAVEQIVVMARAGIPIQIERAYAAAAEVAERDQVAISFDEVEKAAEMFAVSVIPGYDWKLARTQPSITAVLDGLGETNGHPDVVLAGNRVRDVKTAQRAKDTEPSLELGLYALLVEAETGVPVPDVGYWTWVRLKRPYWQVVEYPVTDEIRRWTYERAASYIRAKKADEILNRNAPEVGNYSFPGGAKFPGLCKDCEYAPANGGRCLLALRVEEVSDADAA